MDTQVAEGVREAFAENFSRRNDLGAFAESLNLGRRQQILLVGILSAVGSQICDQAAFLASVGPIGAGA